MSNNTKQPQSVADDLICPITFELPFDPVTAEDGMVYERSAIEAYFKSKKGHAAIKSPVTQQVIGKNLFTAVKHKNTIESLIEMGVIAGSLATRWKEREEGETLRKKAEAGDVASMFTLSQCYLSGAFGVTENYELAFLWSKRAHLNGDALSTFLMAKMLLTGVGVAKNKTEAVMYLCMAAGKGCDYAAYELGKVLVDGSCESIGLGCKREEAIYWLQFSISGSCQYKIMSEEDKADAKLLLDSLIDS